jgi:hypothetical protein
MDGVAGSDRQAIVWASVTCNGTPSYARGGAVVYLAQRRSCLSKVVFTEVPVPLTRVGILRVYRP